MKRKIELTIDIKVKQYNSLILKQMDTTEISCKILDEGISVDLSSLTADIIFTKPDEKIVIQSSNIEISSNTIKMVLLEDCLRQSGNAKMEIELKKSNEVLSSFYIPIKIEATSKENIHSDNTPNYIESLEDAIQQELIRQQNENTRNTAESVRVAAEETRVTNENTRNTAESTRVAAEETRVANENARNTAESARATAEETRIANETARTTAENTRVAEFNSMKNQVKPVLESIFVVTQEIAANTNFTIPINYKVGENTLEVYYMGENLIRDTDNQEGHYKEIGEEGSISNILQVGWKVNVGRYFKFVVRGDYNA